MYMFITQCVGFIGTILFLFSYQFKSKQRLFLFHLLAYGICIIHYAMLGALTGSFALIINTFRSFVLLEGESHRWARWKGWVYVIVILYAITMVYTWIGPMSILPCVATSSATVAYFSKKNKPIRMVNLLVTSPLWFIYDGYCLSYSGVINEVITMLSIIISIRRIGWKNMDD